MHQVSVEYVKGYGEKKSEKPQVGCTDGQTESKPINPSSETGRGLMKRQLEGHSVECIPPPCNA